MKLKLFKKKKHVPTLAEIYDKRIRYLMSLLEEGDITEEERVDIYKELCTLNGFIDKERRYVLNKEEVRNDLIKSADISRMFGLMSKRTMFDDMMKYESEGIIPSKNLMPFVRDKD